MSITSIDQAKGYSNYYNIMERKVIYAKAVSECFPWLIDNVNSFQKQRKCFIVENFALMIKWDTKEYVHTVFITAKPFK